MRKIPAKLCFAGHLMCVRRIHIDLCITNTLTYHTRGIVPSVRFGLSLYIDAIAIDLPEALGTLYSKAKGVGAGQVAIMGHVYRLPICGLNGGSNDIPLLKLQFGIGVGGLRR